MSDTARVSVMIVARHPVVRAGLRAQLDREPRFDIVGEFERAEEALAFSARQPPDVALVDPDSDDVSLGTVAALAEASDRRVLVFTSCSDAGFIGRAIEVGAAGVLSKDQPAEMIVRALQKVHAGELWLDRSRTALVLSHAMRRRHDPEALKISSLTPREREIVGLVAEGLRNGAIGERLFISEATVRNHLTSILGKLALADRFDLAVYAFRNGLAAGPLPSAGRDVRASRAGSELPAPAAERPESRARRE